MISERTFRTLELGKVLERLAANTSFSLSREAAPALRPASELSAVQELQHQTAECMRLLDLGVDAGMGGAHDIRPAVTRAERGGALDPTQLLDVRSTLDCAERIARTLGRLDDSYPWLQAQRHRMGHFRTIINAIAGAINDRGEVMDSASPALQRIRSELRVTHTRLVDRLNAMLASAQYRNAVQETLVTTRNGRYVIPIKAEFKGQVKGIVHDQSSSGATLFIEPLGVTELNNQWHQLQLDERDEVDRILHELSAAIGKQAAAVLSTVDALAAVDLGLADALYADIGDEQSIEQSLSTFSSHLTNIISMLRGLSENTLLLLDELGAGTDPTEGSALARALLTYLLERDVRVIATTHYSELKAFAYNEPGVENASVEFDVETLSPTYRLSIGLPGRSNALAIARRLGLDQEITQRAASFLTGEERRVETMLAEIQQDRAATAELYARANEAHRRAEETRERLQRELEHILGEREGIIAAAQAEADESVRRLRDQLDRIEAELRTSTMVPHVSPAALTERLDQVVKAEPTLLPPKPKRERAAQPPAKAAPPRELGVGDQVEVLRLGQRG